MPSGEGWVVRKKRGHKCDFKAIAVRVFAAPDGYPGVVTPFLRYTMSKSDRLAANEAASQIGTL
jgi:hypothetical protein